MIRLRSLLPALLIALAPALLLADDEATTFTRFKETRGGTAGSLEIAQATYKNDKTDVEVVLYGVVHVADRDYYKKVQKDLDAMDVVLYEGVGPATTTKIDESIKAIGEMQNVLGELLDLQFQKDGINYKAKNLVHADMSMDELEKAAGGDMSKVFPQLKMFSDPQMAKQLLPFMRAMKTVGKSFMKGNPAMRNRMKMMMARQLGNADMSAVAGDEMVRVIIVERNKVALSVLDKELEKRASGKIAIFYGAGHMQDMHARLVEKGWHQTKKTWSAAWTIGGSASDDDSTDDDDEAPKKPARERDREPEPKATPAPSGKRWF